MDSQILHFLGGPSVFGSGGRRIDLLKEVEQGLPTKAYRALFGVLSLKPEEEDHLLQVSLRTRRRWGARARLDAATSDRIMRVARILALAADVLEDQGNAVAWLREPSEALGGRTPLESAATDIGAERVTNMLHQMEHGVYA